MPRAQCSSAHVLRAKRPPREMGRVAKRGGGPIRPVRLEAQGGRSTYMEASRVAESCEIVHHQLWGSIADGTSASVVAESMAL